MAASRNKLMLFAPGKLASARCLGGRRLLLLSSSPTVRRPRAQQRRALAPRALFGKGDGVSRGAGRGRQQRSCGGARQVRASSVAQNALDACLSVTCRRAAATPLETWAT